MEYQDIISCAESAGWYILPHNILHFRHNNHPGPRYQPEHRDQRQHQDRQRQEEDCGEGRQPGQTREDLPGSRKEH